MLPFWSISLIEPFMNCARGRSGCRDQAGSCGCGTSILTRRSRAIAPARDGRGG